MADSQIQQLSKQVTQLTSTVKQLESKIDNLITIVKSISNTTTTTQNKTSVVINPSKPKNEVIPISQTYARPKAQTVSVSPFKQNSPSPAPAKTMETPPPAEEKRVSKIMAAKNMFENLSKPGNNLAINRSLSKSLADLSKDNNRTKKVSTPVISIEDKNTLNKSFDETRISNQPSQAQLIKVPPAPPLPQPEVVENNESSKPSVNKITGRKISSATEIKRLEMLEQLKAMLGERKVE